MVHFVVLLRLSDAEKLLKVEEQVKKRIASAKKIARRVKPLAHEGEIAGGMRFDWEKKRQALREQKLAKKLAKEKAANPARDKEMSIDDAKAQVGLTTSANSTSSVENPLLKKLEQPTAINQDEKLASEDIEVMDLEELKKLNAAQKAATAEDDEFHSAEEQDDEDEEMDDDDEIDVDEAEQEEQDASEDEEDCPELVEKTRKEVATPEMVKALLVASAKGDLKQFMNLLVIHKPLSLHSRCFTTGLTALLAACGKGQVHIVRWALGRGADPTVRCRRNGYNAMQYACHAGSSDIITLLMERKKDIKKLCKARSPTNGLGCLHALATSPMDWENPMCQGT